VHNLTYLDYALETIPQDVYDKMDFTKIRISYKSAVKQSDKIVCKYAFVNEKHIVNIFDQNNELKTAIELS
jgi:acyl-ACP thioesterase